MYCYMISWGNLHFQYGPVDITQINLTPLTLSAENESEAGDFCNLHIPNLMKSVFLATVTLDL